MNIGPTEYLDGGDVVFSTYKESGGTAIVIIDPNTGLSLAVATVNLAPYGAPEIGPEQVWLKGWGENKGLPEALERAGIVRRTGETYMTGFVAAELADILTREERKAA